MDRRRHRRDSGEDRSTRAGHRHARLSHLITERVDAIVRDELTDPDVQEVALTGAQLSPDGQHLYLWFTAPDAVVAGAALARATPLVRTLILERIGTDRVPHLHFAPDPRGDPCLG